MRATAPLAASSASNTAAAARPKVDDPGVMPVPIVCSSTRSSAGSAM